jgi:hypothetical protein
MHDTVAAVFVEILHGPFFWWCLVFKETFGELGVWLWGDTLFLNLRLAYLVNEPNSFDSGILLASIGLTHSKTRALSESLEVEPRVFKAAKDTSVLSCIVGLAVAPHWADVR